jgi:hypothetical protein
LFWNSEWKFCSEQRKFEFNFLKLNLSVLKILKLNLNLKFNSLYLYTYSMKFKWNLKFVFDLCLLFWMNLCVKFEWMKFRNEILRNFEIRKFLFLYLNLFWTENELCTLNLNEILNSEHLLKFHSRALFLYTWVFVLFLYQAFEWNWNSWMNFVPYTLKFYTWIWDLKWNLS